MQSGHESKLFAWNSCSKIVAAGKSCAVSARLSWEILCNSLVTASICWLNEFHEPYSNVLLEVKTSSVD